MKTSKVCRKCKEEKLISEFHINKRNKDGYSSICGVCRNKKAAEDYKSFGSAWLRKLKNTFNITINDYDTMFEKQNGVCAICGRFNRNGQRLSVDHNHKTGKIRALLCGNCNSALGLVYEDVDILLNMIKYIHEDKYGRYKWYVKDIPKINSVEIVDTIR